MKSTQGEMLVNDSLFVQRPPILPRRLDARHHHSSPPCGNLHSPPVSSHRLSLRLLVQGSILPAMPAQSSPLLRTRFSCSGRHLSPVLRTDQVYCCEGLSDFICREDFTVHALVPPPCEFNHSSSSESDLMLCDLIGL